MPPPQLSHPKPLNATGLLRSSRVQKENIKRSRFYEKKWNACAKGIAGEQAGILSPNHWDQAISVTSFARKAAAKSSRVAAVRTKEPRPAITLPA